jgi:hypothetical protein
MNRVIAIIPVLVLVAPGCSTAQRTGPPNPPSSDQVHPDLSGSWVRLRDVKNFIDNTLSGPVNGKRVGPLFSEKIIVTQDAGGLRVLSAMSDAPPAKELRLGDSLTRVGTVEHVSWEIDTNTHTDTIVSSIESNASIGGVPGTGRSILRLWVDADGQLIVQGSIGGWRNDQVPPTLHDDPGQPMSTTTYVREGPFKGLARARLTFDIAGDSEACDLPRESVSSTVTQSLSGSIAVIDDPARADTAEIRVAVRAVRSLLPQVPATAVVISVVQCELTMSVDVTDGKLPPATLYRDARSFSGSPPNTAQWVLRQIKTDLEELVSVVELANGKRRPF